MPDAITNHLRYFLCFAIFEDFWTIFTVNLVTLFDRDTNLFRWSVTMWITVFTSIFFGVTFSDRQGCVTNYRLFRLTQFAIIVIAIQFFLNFKVSWIIFSSITITKLFMHQKWLKRIKTHLHTNFGAKIQASHQIENSQIIFFIFQ